MNLANTPVYLEGIERGGLSLAMPEFLFLRHGQTGHNLRRLMQGHTDIPLDATGQRQAALAADLFEACCDIDQVVSSDLSRARETAEAVATRLGLPVSVDAGLRERSFGPLEGGEIVDGIWSSRLDGVEPIQEFADRIVDAVTRHVSTSKTLLVAHGGVLRVLCHLLGADLPEGGTANALPLRLLNAVSGWHVHAVSRPDARTPAASEGVSAKRSAS